MLEIRRGAWGMVYKVSDTRLKRSVAIKVLPADRGVILSTSADSFRRSGRRQRSTIPTTIYDIGSEGGTDFIVIVSWHSHPERDFTLHVPTQVASTNAKAR